MFLASNICWVSSGTVRARYCWLPRAGSTTVSDTLGEGTTLKVFMMRSGYSSRTLLMSSVPIPDPVPPPSEWVSWKPCRQSQFSHSLRTTSRTESTSSAPSV
ncbi:hypothetical protein MC885_009137 [Smutsia gigantea]|nr:hypothetical protein MC885_009137 [Smutsia gigantea]